ncbi:transporter substrate-binding domain-containing protein [Psychrilyobacter atlanticus]|uniref:transporter substrate-binding domain-containing protein n=1 Tax=Psychrilyobacter atlanticus TaxID=271091 RepID=UPI000402F5B2|nr:transporter substrate-binding domain-containing protein [Psychrilyobacter atlanticus]
MKKIMQLVMILAVGVIMTACGGSKEEKVVVVGTAPNFVPFEYMDGDKIVGFDMDLLDEVSKETGLKFKVVGMDFSGLLPALQTKKIDLIVAGMSITEDRKKNVNFSHPYFNVSQVIMVGEGSKEIEKESDIAGKKIGVVMGTTSDTIAENLSKELDGVETVKYNKLHEAVLSLQAEKIDMIILDYQQAKKTTENNNGLKLSDYTLQSEEYAMAMGKDETELLTQINKALEKIIKSKKYNELIEKHIKN